MKTQEEIQDMRSSQYSGKNIKPGPDMGHDFSHIKLDLILDILEDAAPTKEEAHRCICGQKSEAHEDYSLGALIHLLSVGNRRLPLTVEGRRVSKLVLSDKEAELILENAK